MSITLTNTHSLTDATTCTTICTPKKWNAKENKKENSSSQSSPTHATYTPSAHANMHAHHTHSLSCIHYTLSTYLSFTTDCMHTLKHTCQHPHMDAHSHACTICSLHRVQGDMALTHAREEFSEAISLA